MTTANEMTNEGRRIFATIGFDVDALGRLVRERIIRGEDAHRVIMQVHFMFDRSMIDRHSGLGDATRAALATAAGCAHDGARYYAMRKFRTETGDEMFAASIEDARETLHAGAIEAARQWGGDESEILSTIPEIFEVDEARERRMADECD